MSCKGTLVLFLIALLSILELNCDYQSVNAVQLSTQMKICSLPYYFFFFFFKICHYLMHHYSANET